MCAGMHETGYSINYAMRSVYRQGVSYMRRMVLVLFALIFPVMAYSSDKNAITADQARAMAVKLYEDEARQKNSNRSPGGIKTAFSEGKWVVFIVDKKPMVGAHRTYYFSPEGELLKIVSGE